MISSVINGYLSSGLPDSLYGVPFELVVMRSSKPVFSFGSALPFSPAVFVLDMSRLPWLEPCRWNLFFNFVAAILFAWLAMYFGGKGSDVVAMLIELEMRHSFLVRDEQLEGNTYTFVSGQDPLERTKKMDPCEMKL